MTYNLENKDKNSIAMIDDTGIMLTYAELLNFSENFSKLIKSRTLIFILADNSIGSAAGYISAIENKVVPLLLNSEMDLSLLFTLIDEYSPEYLWVPNNVKDKFEYDEIGSLYGHSLLKTNLVGPELYSELSLLLTTSGSTGSPKLVRHSYKNILANAKNVSEVFNIDVTDRAMASLPLYFTQGLSVLSSYIYSGATVVLTNYGLTQKEFWNTVRDNKVSVFTGVPYSYEILQKIRFFRMNLPDLKVLSQGGGRLNNELFQQIVEYTEKNNKKFFATYGATETTSRMACLVPEYVSERCGSIGKAINNGKIKLINDDGTEITAAETVGELVYQGDNVTLGYAECVEDLLLGDVRCGIYPTGDLAKFDKDGFIYIVGRKKRFLKLYGYRVGLDEMERLIKDSFQCNCACVGTDKKMIVYVTEENLCNNILNFIYEKTKIHFSAFEVRFIKTIPKNAAGKTLYSELGVE